MKHLCSIAILMLACSRAFGDTASDKRELTQLVNDIHVAVVNADMAFLEGVLHQDYVHHGQRGTIENRAQYLKNRKTGRVDFESLGADKIKVRLYGDTAIVTYRSTAKGKDQHGEMDFQRSVTRVFLRRGGRWQQVHSQATLIQFP